MGLILLVGGVMALVGVALGIWASRALECPRCGVAPADARWAGRGAVSPVDSCRGRGFPPGMPMTGPSSPSGQAKAR